MFPFFLWKPQPLHLECSSGAGAKVPRDDMDCTGRSRDSRRMLIQVLGVNTKTTLTMDWFYSGMCLERKRGQCGGSREMGRSDEGKPGEVERRKEVGWKNLECCVAGE